MSFEPDTNDIRIRQLAEELAKIREEQFATSFPTNFGGGSNVVGGGVGVGAPTTGVASWLPNVIRITKDTGVIDKIAFDDKNVNKDFFIGDIITGQSSGATATIGDIDITGTTTGFLFLVQGSITGTFTDNEMLSTVSESNIARVDLTFGTTQIGRGHLNAGSASIIVDTLESPAEIHFIDNSQQDGQLVLLRAQDGLTIRVRRAQTNDGNTGNLDLDESFDLTENALVFFQFQVASNVTPDGGWVPLITNITTVTGGTGGGGTTFPILYPQELLGDQGLVTVSLNLNQSNGHYKLITMIDDIGLAFNTLPPSTNGFKFYVLLTQDGVGGHDLVTLPTTVKDRTVLQAQLDTTANAQTLFQFSTADGGATWHGQIISPTGSGGDASQWSFFKALNDVDMDTFNIFDLDVLRYAKGIEPGADSVIGFGVYGSAVENDTKLKWSIPRGIIGTPRFYEWQFDLSPVMRLTKEALNEKWALDLLGEGLVKDTRGITFNHQFPAPANSSITPESLELRYDNGFGTGQGGFHGFRVANPTFPQWEVREFVNRSNVNLDMITNNIFDIDQAQFSNFGGFNNSVDHGIRTITGGNEGIVVNIPIGGFPSFNLYFENVGLTGSDLEYNFTKSALFMNMNDIKDVQSVQFTNGTRYLDQGPFDFQIRTGLRTGANPAPQVMQWFAQEQTGFETYVDKKIFEITGQEDGPAGVGGGFKLFTDINMQTQNIHNIDVATWEPDVGTGIAGLANGAYGIVADETESLQLGTVPNGVNRPLFLFHAPFNALATDDPRFAWGKNHKVFATLDEGDFHMYSNDVNLKSLIISDGGFRYGVSFQPVNNPLIDGESRMINNSGSLDVVFRSGGQLINLTTLGSGATSFIGFNADDDLRMNTFDINEVDVLRFQPDGANIGAGDYAITADSADENFVFNVPLNRNYLFENALEPIATLDQTGLQLLANTQFFNPQLGARELSLTGIHTDGTLNQNDGAFRLVQVGPSQDVIVATGGSLVNLTTLSAGGGDNLGNHLTLQSLDMNAVLQNSITNFTALTSFFGHSWFFTSSNMTWNVNTSTDFFRWSFNNFPEMELSTTDLNVGNKQVTNVDDPINAKDAVNLQTLTAGLAGVNVSQWSTFPAVSPVNMDGNAFTNFNGWTAGIGQAFSVNPTNMVWNLNSNTHSFFWNLGGFSEMALELGALDLNPSGNPKQILGVADPLNALDAVNLQTLQASVGGDASQWSTFPALQQVDMAQNALNNVTAVAIEVGGGILWDFPSGAFIFADAVGLNFGMFSTDQVDIRFGGLSRATFTNTGHSFDTVLDMNFNKIVNVNSPDFAFEVANKLYVDSVAGTPGGSLLTNPLNIWTGTQVYTGTQHSILTDQVLIGGQISDDIFFLGRVESDFDPSSSGTQIMGGFGLPWDQLHVSEIFMSGVNFSGSIPPNGGIDMNFGRIVFCDDPIAPQDVATKFYVDAQTGGGGSALLASNNTWTGSNNFIGDFFTTGNFQVFGDQATDSLNFVGRFNLPLIPIDAFVDLGNPSNRWRTLYTNFVATRDIDVTNDALFRGDVFTGSGGNLIVSGGGSYIQSGGTMTLSSSTSAVFQGGVFPQGTFFHSGSQLGFFGAGLTTRNTVNDVVATGNAFTNTLLLTGALNALMFALEEYGLINVV